MNSWIGVPLADDKAYQQALERREALLKELKLLDEFISLYQKIFSNQTVELPLREATSNPADAIRRRQRGIVTPERMAELAYEVIGEAGRPMTRSEIVKAIEARGIPVAGTDKNKNLGTILWRHSRRFENIPNRGYWLKGRNLPDE